MVISEKYHKFRKRTLLHICDNCGQLLGETQPHKLRTTDHTPTPPLVGYHRPVWESGPPTTPGHNRQHWCDPACATQQLGHIPRMLWKSDQPGGPPTLKTPTSDQNRSTVWVTVPANDYSRLSGNFQKPVTTKKDWNNLYARAVRTKPSVTPLIEQIWHTLCHNMLYGWPPGPTALTDWFNTLSHYTTHHRGERFLLNLFEQETKHLETAWLLGTP